MPDAKVPLRRRLFDPRRDPLWTALLAILASLLVSFVAILASGRNPVDGYGWMLDGAFGGARPFGETALKTAVLILTGLSVTVAFTVGLFNIGAEGQLIWGALVAAIIGRAVDAPAIVLIPLAILGAALAGAAWAGLAGFLKVTRGVHEVISTILLNWVAIHLVHGWLVTGPFAAHSAAGEHVSIAGTSPIRPAAMLPRLLDGSRLDIGFPLALAIAFGTWFLLTRTRRGFEWRATGAGLDAAHAAGIRTGRARVEAMALGGAFAGIAGALLILGTEHRYPGVFRTGYGFDGIAVALVGAATAPGTALAAFFFGAVRAGATRLQLVGIHPSFAELIQGVAVLLVAAPLVFAPIVRRLRGKAGAPVDPVAPQIPPPAPGGAL